MTPEPPHDDEITGVPLLRTWRAVYAFVTVVFILYVVLLALLPGWFA